MSVRAACLIAAYLVGSFPTALLVGGRRGHDPTAEGSGNPGATNVYRIMGRRAGALVLCGDVVKGVAAALAGAAVFGRAGLLACGGLAVIGHCFPVGRWRHGGKGVATAAGVAVIAFPAVAALALAVWFAVFLPRRKASAASMAAIVVVPVGAAVTGRPGWEIATSAAIAGVVVLRHRSNVGRLLRGQEESLPSRPHRRAS
ncbi:MAG TPA: glycerol-3-phosphate acyltransferase [Acidimicrobiales bacterium]|nr:glycerol-3-phosphate acyltransferase [Acidimicrobiales bacterium]